MELLVVVTIIVLVSAVALPTVLPAFNQRQVSEAARILQGELVGARDRAIHTNQPAGIRLLPDPAFPLVLDPTTGQLPPWQTLAYNRIVPIEAAPEYSEGYCTPLIWGATGSTAYFGSLGTPLSNVPPAGVPLNPVPGPTFGQPMALVLMENLFDPKTGQPNPPTSWFWNIRVGDKVQINSAGPWYTVIGPMVVPPQGITIGGTFYANTEMFVNVGPPAPTSAYANLVPSIGGQAVEYLVLVNGADDNKNGFIDDGFDGIDNNGNGAADLADPMEWYTSVVSGFASSGETEAWLGSISSHATVDIRYTIRRRPAPAAAAKEVSLPTSMLIDATTAFMTQERSRLPVNVYTGYVDIVLNPDGTVVPTLLYSSPSSFGMDVAFLHFWLSDRKDLQAVNLTPPPPGSPTTAAAGPPPLPWAPGMSYYLPIAKPGSTGSTTYLGPYLTSQYAIVSLNARSGQVASNEGSAFLYDSNLGYQNQTGTYNPTNPFIQAEQGLTGAR